MARYRELKIDTKRCERCGDVLPHAKGYCRESLRQTFIKRGRVKLNERWPGYGDALMARDANSRGEAIPPYVVEARRVVYDGIWARSACALCGDEIWLNPRTWLGSATAYGEIWAEGERTRFVVCAECLELPDDQRTRLLRR